MGGKGKKEAFAPGIAEKGNFSGGILRDSGGGAAPVFAKQPIQLLLGQTLEQASQTLDFRTAEYSEDGNAEEYTLIMPGYRQTMRFSDGICTGLRWEYWEFSGALDRMQELASVLSGQYEASGQETLSPYLETESSLSPPDPGAVPQMAWNLPEANGGGTLVLSLRTGETDSFFVELSVQEP